MSTPDYLMQATLRRISGNLLDEVLKELRPKILDNIRATLKEMEPVIQKHHDVRMDQTVFALIVREPREDLNCL